MGAGISDQIAQLKRIMESGGIAQRAFVTAAEAAERGDLASAADRYEEFETAQKEVLRLTDEANGWANPPSPLEPIVGTLVNGLFMHADAMDSLHQPARAEALRRTAGEYATRYLDEARAAEARRSAAASEIARGRFPEALVALHEVRDQFVALGLHLQAARVAMDLADVFQWLGDYSRAIELVDHAAKLANEAKPRAGLKGFEDAVAKERIRKERAYYRGLIARYAGRYEEAEENLREALAEYASAGPGLTGVRYQWAMLLAKRGRSADALGQLEAIEPSMRAHGMLRPKVAALLRSKAEVLLALGRDEEALAAIVEALADGRTYPDPDVRWMVEWQHGTILRRLGRLDQALRQYRAAVETVGSLRRAPLGYRLDNAYLASKLPLFRDAIDLCVELDRPLDCAWMIDQIKARSLSAVMGAAASPSVDAPELSNEFDALARRIDAIEYRGFAGGWTDEDIAERSQLFARRSEVVERLRFSDPRWRNMSTPVELDMESLRSDIEQRDLAVLTLFFDEDQLTAVLLTPHVQLVRRRRLDRRVLDGLDRYYANLLAADPEDPLHDPGGVLGLRAEDFVDRELWSHARACSRIIVVPHRGLHLLPWSALTFDGRRLFQLRPVGVLPNLACVGGLALQPVPQPSIVLIGPPDYEDLPRLHPLEAAVDEVAELRDLYEGRGGMAAGPFSAEAATETALLRELAATGREECILHICCHAAANVDEPMSTGLFLCDGKVDAAEISRVRTSFNEVVLSACSTGWRPTEVAAVELIADDCLGLPGAFLEAGARNVLVSIPQADDEAAMEFMVRYHRARSGGVAPLEAYRQAQEEMLAEPDLEPGTWIGMTMYGS